MQSWPIAFAVKLEKSLGCSKARGEPKTYINPDPDPDPVVFVVVFV
jgi:hypothetical protein